MIRVLILRESIWRRSLAILSRRAPRIDLPCSTRWLAGRMSWVNLTRVVANAGAGMLVDAYFEAEFVPWLVESTTLRRVLISSRYPSAEGDLARMVVALATVSNAGSLEVRATNSRELHDRCLIRADGTLQLLGSSVNGVGRNIHRTGPAPVRPPHQAAPSSRSRSCLHRRPASGISRSWLARQADRQGR
jgi:hypothetical protein